MAKKKKTPKKEENLVRICPHCKSPDVELDKSNPTFFAYGTSPEYVCNACGHTGYPFPELPLEELEAFEEDAKKEHIIDNSQDKSPKADTRLGNFLVRVFWKISAFFVLIIGIMLVIGRGAFQYNRIESIINLQEPVFLDVRISLILGIFYIAMALLMLYITYFKKRKLK